MPEDGRAVVAGVNLVRRHTRQTAQTEGGIISKELTIHLSNLAISSIRRRASRRVSALRFSTTAARCVSRGVPET